MNNPSTKLKLPISEFDVIADELGISRAELARKCGLVQPPATDSNSLVRAVNVYAARWYRDKVLGEKYGTKSHAIVCSIAPDKFEWFKKTMDMAGIKFMSLKI